MKPAIRFVTTEDDVRIAYGTHGDGPPLVFVRGWISHLEFMWQDVAFRAFFETLAQQFRVVRYDGRGNGLSDREVEEIDFEALILDLEAVIDRLALEEVTLYGTTFGGPIAIGYAARHPERVSKLILACTYACGQEITSPEQQEAITSMLSRLRTMPDAAYSMLSYLTDPTPDQHQHRRATRARESISGRVAAELYTLCFKIDVSSLLSQLQAPTLVVHRRHCAVPFKVGRKLASLIPDARFAALDGTSQNLWEGDGSAALAAFGDFLGVELRLPPAPASDESRAPLTIFFTDMESSTAITQRLGDAKAQELVRSHNTIVRDSLKGYGGTEIKHTGDGIMASFVSASRAIECAIAVQRAVADHAEQHEAPFRVRIGLNAGEPVAEEEDLFGTAVHLASRICNCAEPGQILVSNVVRELAAGKGFLFADRGEAALRGFDDLVRMHEVSWEA